MVTFSNVWGNILYNTTNFVILHRMVANKKVGLYKVYKKRYTNRTAKAFAATAV